MASVGVYITASAAVELLEQVSLFTEGTDAESHVRSESALREITHKNFHENVENIFWKNKKMTLTT
jgi:hypothetical protein